jgi:crotonobetainyl-CoA:carnitine CoA-transferase CaiB-like acyl-CoA transferase
MEVANLVAAPYAGLLLADLGADVIKVEPPGGDLARGFGPYIGGQSVFFMAMNRGKRSILLDAKHPRDRVALAKLAGRVDVILHNLRAGAMERMGLGEVEVRRDNPSVVYAVISAFGSDGPYADRAGIDVVFQGESGMISITGRPGDPPQKTATTIGDYVAATHIATAIAAALKEGVGRRVEVAVRDALISVQSGWNALHFADGAQPPRTGTASPYLAPNQVLAAADGHLTLAVTSDRHFAILCEVIDRPDLAKAFPGNEERMAGQTELAAELEAVFRTGPSADWVELLVGAGLPAGRVLTLPEVFADPQVQHNEMVVEIDDLVAEPVRTTGTPLRVDSAPARAVLPPPKLGEHTAEVLAEIGMDEAGEAGA